MLVILFIQAGAGILPSAVEWISETLTFCDANTLTTSLNANSVCLPIKIDRNAVGLTFQKVFKNQK